MRSRHLFGYALAALLLSGCASKEPLDYLPECAAYYGVNAARMREQSGSKRLLKVMEALDPAGTSGSEKVGRFVGGVQSLTVGGRPAFFGIVTGQPGMSQALIEGTKKSGSATETKIDGKRAVTVTGGPVMVVLNDAAMLVAGSQSDFGTMQQTARNKNPRATASVTFQKFNSLMGTHGMVVVLNTEPLLALARPQLAMVEKLDPKGYAALNKVRTASIVFDWEAAPKVEAVFNTDTKEDSEAVAALLNNTLMMAKMQPGVAQQMPAFLSNLTAKSGANGATLAVEIPKEQADAMLDKAEKALADLPKDPKQREAAAQRLIMELMTSGASGSPSATDTRMVPPPNPGTAPPPSRPGAMVPHTAPGLTVPAQPQQMPAQQPMRPPAFTPPAAATPVRQ